MKNSALKFRFLIGSTFIGLSLFAGMTSAQEAQLAEGVDAIVNDSPITRFDIRQRIRFILISAGVQNPTEQDLITANQQAVNSLINEKLQIQEAAKFKVSMSDAEVDNIISNQAHQNGGTLEDFFAQLAQAGISKQSWRDKTRAEALWQRIVSGRFGSRVKISPQQVNEFLNRIQATADKPQYHVAEIFIEVSNPEEDARAFEGSNTLVTQIKAGASFAGVAEQFSYAPSAAAGGDLGWVVQGELKPEVAAMIDSLNPGEISNPIKVQNGYEIIYLRDKRAGQEPIVTLLLKELEVKLPSNASESAWQKAENTLNSARSALNGCESVNKVANKFSLTQNNLGGVQLNQLKPQFQEKLKGLNVGQSSLPYRTSASVKISVVCDSLISGPGIPTRDQISDNLYDSELNLIARRYLRDLRRDAAIVNR